MTRSGWYRDSARHSLAARGIKTKRYYQFKAETVNVPPGTFSEDAEQPFSPSPPKSSFTDSIKTAASSVAAALRRKAQTGVSSGLKRTAKDVAGTTEAIEDMLASESDFAATVRRARKGQLSDALQALAARKNELDSRTGMPLLDAKGNPITKRIATDEQREAIFDAFEQRARELVMNKQRVPDQLLERLPKEVRAELESELKEIGSAQKSADESPFHKALRDEARRKAVEFADVIEPTTALAEGAGALDRARKEAKSKEGAEALGDVEGGALTGLGDTPFLQTNALFGDHADGDSPLQMMPDELPRLQSSFDDIPSISDNFAFADRKKELMEENTAQNVTRKVDSWVGAAGQLSDIDTSAFDRGTEAFKSGNREGLLDSIAELQGEEAKMKDRWRLVELTHSQMVTNPNHEAAFQESGGTNFFLGAFGGGAPQFADQTEKLNKVKSDMKKANDKVFTRRKMLQFRLQRMDAHVPAETDVPENVERFGSRRFFDISIKDMTSSDNPIFYKTMRPDSNPMLSQMRGSTDE